jgi:hypothetical protein
VANDLDGAVDALRARTDVPVALKAQIAAAHAFGLAAAAGDLHLAPAKIENLSRGLIREYPQEIASYQALYALCRSSDAKTALRLANEICNSSAPEEIKTEARLIRDRFNLVGKSIKDKLGSTVVSKIEKANSPLIIYSWASWGPGSIDLGRMIQARRFEAVAVCVDESVENAAKVASRTGMGGLLVYDVKGLKGDVASALKFTGAGQIYLVDKDGVIRDVWVGSELESKLKNLGFSPAALVRPVTPRS